MENMKIEDGSIVLNVNPKVYDLDTVYSAAYVFLDKAFILLDGDPEKEILVRLRPKTDYDLEKLGNEFFNELINYGDYSKRAADTRKIREMILQRAIITNDPSAIQDDELDSVLEDMDDDEDWIDDPEGIAVPWEEKYGKKADDVEVKDEDKTEQ